MESGQPLQLYQVRVTVPNVLNQPLQREVAMEVMKNLISVKPRPIHPKMLDFNLLHNTDKATCVVIVGMRKHHVVYEETRVVSLDVINDGVGRIGPPTVSNMEQVTLSVVTVANHNRVA
ncbi:MAG: hypothetical protein DI562_00285 [Stenotrophomonas acidaminiphila]|nr:MAG: hypothetical protein DI562_00285 [Stenotrophomonas acidaminiphila]